MENQFAIAFIYILICGIILIMPAIVVKYYKPNKNSTVIELNNKLNTNLAEKGFNLDKIVSMSNPEKLWYFQKQWAPCVNCFLCVDDKNKQWAISQNGDIDPHIYKYSDFRGFDIEIDGKGVGDMGYNAAVGYLFGGTIGAVAGAALTKRKASVKEITVIIRVNSLQNPMIYIPLFTGPQRGYQDTGNGLELIMAFVSQLEQTFNYIDDNKYTTANS